MNISKHFKSMISSAGLVLMASLAGISGSATAGTPDGETPANEGVCDVLKADGVTKGLYGLCVAFCEAQDLDASNAAPPNNKILRNYDRKKQAGDPDMPCVSTPCMCWDQSDLDTLAAVGNPPKCSAPGDSIKIEDAAQLFYFAEVNTSSKICSYWNFGDGILNTFSIETDAEAQACYSQIENTCDNNGIPILQ